jgi:hypothetical protein
VIGGPFLKSISKEMLNMIRERLVNDSLLIAPKAQTNSATTTANLDTKGANYATIRVAFASELNTNAVGPTLVLSQSDDTVVTNFATIDTQTGLDLTAAREVLYGVDLRGKKRYLRLAVTTATATNDNVTFAAVATLSDLENAPNGTTSVADTVVFA